MLIINKDNFEQEVLQAEGLTIIKFWGTDCRNCKALEPIFQTIAEQNAQAAKFSMLNAMEDKALARGQKVLSVPTIVFYRDGEQIDRLSGSITKEQIVGKIAEISTPKPVTKTINKNKSLEELQTLFSETKKKYTYNPDIPTEERIAGAIMGAIIGDALGVGCHWIYNYPELWRNYGPWIDGYRDPKATNEGGHFEMISAYRYQAGVRAGMNSQSGQLLQIMLENIAENCRKNEQGEFVNDEYVKKINNFFEYVLLPEATFDSNIDIYNSHPGVVLENPTYLGQKGGIKCFSGRYTNEEVRFNFDYWYNHGKKDGRWWMPESQVTLTSTSEGAQWGIILAALYRDPQVLFYKAYDFLNMWYCDKAFITMQLIYIMTLHAFINNIPFEQYENYIIALFDKLNVTNRLINSFDDVMMFNAAHVMARHDHLYNIVDDRFVPLIYGADCHIKNLLCAAYYYALKYADDFEQGILTAVNSGGQNMARATLTGGLIGAMVGIKGIPQRFIDGLKNEDRFIPEGYATQGDYLLDLAKTVAEKTNGVIPKVELSYQSDCGCYVSMD